MLPASCSQRLLSVLNCALEECAEQNALLELQLRRCHRLLGAWKLPSSDGVQQNTSITREQENKSSAEEQRELTLLNRALEKAMRIRSTLTPQVHEVPAKPEHDPDKKVTSSANPVRCPASVIQDKTPRPTSVTLATKPNPTKKPQGYVLHAPYRTIPEKRRSRGASVAAVQVARSTKESGKVHTREPALQKDPRSSSTSRPNQLQSEVAASHAPKTSPKGGGADRLLEDLQVDGPGHTDPVSSEKLILSGASEGSKAQLFTLKESGHTLKLPLPFRQASSKNERLWEKILLQQSNPCAVSETQFIQKLETTIDSASAAFSPAAIEKEVMGIKNTYTLLNQRLAAQSSLENTGHLTWEKEFQGLLTLESIQAAVSLHLSRLQELRKAADLHVRLDAGSRAGTTSALQVAGLVIGKGECRKSAPLTRPLLVYSSVQELKEMETQKLRVAHLQQQIDMQKNICTFNGKIQKATKSDVTVQADGIYCAMKHLEYFRSTAL
ncbi:tubulin epsilon and delta complex protein 2 isoform X2 [Pleurodeles waltl]|uniref:tubulin epsilon and delta complex protein 2 isoform X2 n=1 Tax=Pleurodeles waltl TaxID=8319 RepID=UPI003709533E